MDPMLAATFNVYWWLSILAPVVVMLAATYWHRRSVLIIGVLLSLVITYVLCNFSVQEKWRIRNEIAQTESEREYAQRDGANLVFTLLFIGPFEAIVYTSLWGAVGWRLWPRLRRKRQGHDVAA
jgi:MFS family permease